MKRVGTLSEEERLEHLKASGEKDFTHYHSHDKDYWVAHDGRKYRWLKLKPGGYIHRHTDKAGWRRFHVIQTNPESLFYLDGVEYHLEQGGIYEIDGRLEHWAVNDGDCDRIHYLDLDIAVGGQ